MFGHPTAKRDAITYFDRTRESAARNGYGLCEVRPRAPARRRLTPPAGKTMLYRENGGDTAAIASI